eukprot:9317940-Pyramimonas_sp.AAC.1
MACVQRPVPAKISRVLSPHANAGLNRRGSKSPKSGHSTSVGSSTAAVTPPAALPRCCCCAAKALQCWHGGGLLATTGLPSSSEA